MANWKQVSIRILALVILALSAGQARAASCHDGDIVTVDGTVSRIKELPNNGGNWIFLESPDLDCGTVFVMLVHTACQLGDRIHVEKAELEQDSNGNNDEPMPYRWMLRDENNGNEDNIVTCRQDTSNLKPPPEN